MFSVPGRYSGGASGAFTWTQTLGEVNLRAALPEGTLSRDVRCTFGARKLEVAWSSSDVPPELSGELAAVVVVDDCLWVVEREAESGDVVLVTLRKAVPGVWDRLFAADPPLETAPALLDGVGREAPEMLSKAEQLKQAKARVATELDGPSRAKPYVLDGLKGETRTLARAEGMPELPVLVLRGCVDCAFTVPSELAAIKLQVESCERCTITLSGRLLTELVEVWKCVGCELVFQCKASTVQSDGCTDLRLRYACADHFQQLLHTGTRRLAVSFDDAKELGATLDFDALQAERADKLDEEVDQFITRFEAAGRPLRTELVIRLCNDFPTTEREVRDYEERTRVHGEMLDEVVSAELLILALILTLIITLTLTLALTLTPTLN